MGLDFSRGPCSGSGACAKNQPVRDPRDMDPPVAVLPKNAQAPGPASSSVVESSQKPAVLLRTPYTRRRRDRVLAALAEPRTPKTSGLYLTASDYTDGRLADYQQRFALSLRENEGRLNLSTHSR